MTIARYDDRSLDSLDELEQMRLRYAQELPELVSGLSVAVTQLRGRPEQPALLCEARRRAHQIAGMAGSFGFGAVGDACAAIEAALLKLQRGAGNAWVEIDRVLAQLTWVRTAGSRRFPGVPGNG